jgi:hypothetical protein
LRSSSVGGFSWCQARYYFVYVLGLPDEPSKKASLGSCSHKALELWACKKLAIQEGRPTFRDDELGREFDTSSLTPEEAFDAAYTHYAQEDWDDRDQLNCFKWMKAVLDWGGGIFNPMNRDVVAPELYFDLEIKKEWAKYDYVLPDGQSLKGYLSIRGTMDLLTRVAPGVLEYIDYKTGQRKNWETGKPKEYADFKKDSQFLLYYYALKQLFPDEQVIFTVFYNKDGGPFTICFDDEDLIIAEEMLRKNFEEIRDCREPEFVFPSWKCDRVPCHFHVQRSPDGSQSMCQYLRGELLQLGMEKVTAKHADFSKLNRYTGGGRTDRAA